MPHLPPETAEKLKYEKIVCVYFLTDENGHVVYVGKSTDLYSRLQCHNAERGQYWCGVSFLRMPKDMIAAQEAIWISRLSPRMNVAGVKREVCV